MRLVEMKKLLDVVRLSREHSERILGFYNIVPFRGARYQANIKWVSPERKDFYLPTYTGDLVQMPAVASDSIMLAFKHSKELETADEKVKKIFSLHHQAPKYTLEMYEHDLVQKVKSHEYETDSTEIKIAKLTAEIRFYQTILAEKPKQCDRLKRSLYRKIKMRKSLLALLRGEDYKKFEWLLDKLELEFRPELEKKHAFVTRKKSLELLAKLRVEQFKEERLANLKKIFDDQKVPFLEKKLLKLKEINQIEKKNNLPATVTDKDIEDCVKKLEEVKVKVAERAKVGYKRKIHPFFLEAFDEKLLWEKEKAGELIREQQFCKENSTAEN